MTRLAKTLEQAGISQKWLATKTGLTAVTISRYVNGNRKPNVSNALKIAKALEMPVEVLFEVKE